MEMPSPTQRRGDGDVAPEHLARLAALAQRRRAPPFDPPSERDVLEARLAALAERRTSSPPPAPNAQPGPSPPMARTKRRHAAKGARATALGLSLASTGALASLFALTSGQTANQTQAASIIAAPQAGGQGSQTSTTAAAAATDATASATDVAAETVVQGGVFHNKWGDVQVQATFSADGALIDVTTLQIPYRDGKSVRINERAVPQLNSEALTAQNAQVDTVSGATYTSNDYRRSLQSAIDLANSSGITSIV